MFPDPTGESQATKLRKIDLRRGSKQSQGYTTASNYTDEEASSDADIEEAENELARNS